MRKRVCFRFLAVFLLVMWLRVGFNMSFCVLSVNDSLRMWDAAAGRMGGSPVADSETVPLHFFHP